MLGCAKTDKQNMGRVKEMGCSRIRAYLIGVHFELAHDLDGHLIARLSISCFVDIAEGAIAHLLQQDVSLETGIARELARPFSFFGYNGVDFGVSVLNLLVLASGIGGSSSSLSNDIAVVNGGHRVLAGLR